MNPAAVVARPRKRIGLVAVVLLAGKAWTAAPAASQSPTPSQRLPHALEEPNLEGADASVREAIAKLRRGIDEASAKATDAVAATGNETLAARLGALGRAYAALHLQNAATSALRNAVALAPREPAWWYYLAVVTEQLGLHEDAQQALERVLELEPDDFAARLRLGQVQLRAQQLDRAESSFRAASSTSADSAAALRGLADIARARGDCRQAVAGYQRVLELQPAATAVHYPAAMCWRELGDLEAARRHLAALGEGEVRFPDPRIEALATELSGLPQRLSAAAEANARNQPQEALALFDSVLRDDPENVAARRGRATTLLRLGDLARAREALVSVLELDPHHPVTLHDLATLEVRSGDLEAAADAYRRATLAAPDFAAAELGLGTTLRDLGRAEEAVAALERARALSGDAPGDRRTRAEAALALAEGLVRGVLPAAAVAQSAEALAGEAAVLVPNEPAILLRSARLLGALGRHLEAVEVYETVLGIDLQSEQAHFGTSMASLLAGDETKAFASLERGISALPESVPLRHGLARLLACSRSDDLRDGARALRVAEALFNQAPSADLAETVAMALQETGQNAQAIALQQQVVERGGGEAARQRLAAYSQGLPCRAPWATPTAQP